MSNEYNGDSLIEFMDIMEKQGTFKSSTARSRKIACTKILDSIQGARDTDLREIDVEDYIRRFSNLNAKNLNNESLRTYGNRFRIALRDFLEWKKDPISFKPNSKSRNTTAKQQIKNTKSQSNKSQSGSTTSHLNQDLGTNFPIPLRNGGHVVIIKNLPNDITNEEAEKISAVVKALAV